MSRSYRRCALAGLAAATAALLPLTSAPALASTEVVAAPLPAPSGLTPADAPDSFPQTVRKDIVVSWNPVEGATGYRVEIGRDDTWSDAPLASYDVLNTALAIPQGNAYQTYTWRVAALSGSVVGHWTSESTNAQNRAQFTKGWRQAPGSLAVSFSGSGVPTFMWSAVPGVSRYNVALSPAPLTSSDFEAAAVKGALCGTVRNRLTPVLDGAKYAEGLSVGADPCTVALDPSTTYYWGVQGVDESASDGGPEKTLKALAPSFTTGAATAVSGTPASSPVETSLGSDPDRLCTLENGSPERAVCNDVPTLRWSSVSGASYYKIVLSPDSLFQSVVDIVKTEATEWTSQLSWSEMSPSLAMYYSVQACADSDPAPDVTKEVCSPIDFSTPRSFRKVSPRLAGLSVPGPNGRLAFSWTSHAAVLAAAERPSAGAASTATQDAKGYHVQVATADHPSFDSTVIDATVDGPVTDPGRFTASGGTTFIPTDELLSNGSFLWRVQAVDSAGNKLPWSLSQAFVRDTIPPKVISVLPATKVGVTQPVTLTFSEPVTGVSASSISVSPAVGYTVTVLTSTTARLTPSSGWLTGGTYAITPSSSVMDAVGNTALATATSFKVNPLADDGSPAISYTAGWQALSATNALGGRFHIANSSNTSRPYAVLTFRGTAVALTSCLGPTNGYVDVLVDGVRKARVNTYRSYSGCGIKVATVSGLTRGQHQVKVLTLGAHSVSSRGNYVSLDALTVTP